MIADPAAGAALVIEGLIKDFGGQRALDGVDLAVRSGEIHALLGENGAGKSTLIKVLAGVHRPDGGELSVGGTHLQAGHTPADAARLGLHFVHQDLALVDELSVAENIALDVGYGMRRGLVSMARTERRAEELLARQGVAVDPTSPVGALPQAEKVMVAIARAFHADARVIVLDEVSASLPGPEVVRLQAAVRRAADGGLAVIWITHRLDELDGFADRLTVLRDGRRVVSADVADAAPSQIVEWIVGREVDLSRTRPHTERLGEPKLSVRGLSGPGLAAPLDLDVMAGEIVGLTGLIGAGAAAAAALLGGSPRVTAGTMTLDGAALPIGRPRAMRLAGCNYVPGDRARDGAIASLTVRENLFPVRIGTGPDDGRWRSRGTERAAAARLVRRFGVQPGAAVEMPLETLSGGNQQKVIFGRALRTSPRLLVLADPTAGVDVGARAELYALIRVATDEGAAVILASSDFDEVVRQADRALVMARGHVTAELSGDRLTRDALAAASYSATHQGDPG
jgi:ribose transport system ATP-binding protein